MTVETSLSLSLVFALVAMVGTIMGIVNVVKSNNEKASEKRLDIEKQFVALNVKLDSMSTRIGSLIQKNDNNITEIQEIHKTLILETERIETLSKVKEDHENRIKELEDAIRRCESA